MRQGGCYAAGMDRVLEQEVMDTEEEATEYDAMDHAAVNRALLDRFAELGGLFGRILDIGTGPAWGTKGCAVRPHESSVAEHSRRAIKSRQKRNPPSG